MIGDMDRIRKAMKLKKIPHKSTISRELRRIPELWIRIVLREIIRAIGIPSKFAVDSTGIQISYRPYYYTQRIGEVGKIREGLKLHAAVDIERKLITNAIVTKWHTNDSPYLIPLLEEERVKEVYADKGYDSLRNIRFVLNKGGTPYIAIRNKARRGLRRRLLEKSKSIEWKKKYSQEGGSASFLNPHVFMLWNLYSTHSKELLAITYFPILSLLLLNSSYLKFLPMISMSNPSYFYSSFFMFFEEFNLSRIPKILYNP